MILDLVSLETESELQNRDYQYQTGFVEAWYCTLTRIDIVRRKLSLLTFFTTLHGQTLALV